MNWYYLFFDFRGRIGRGAFWRGVLILLGLQLAILWPLMQIFEADLTTRPPALWFRNLNLLIDTAFAWPTLAVLAKRQHDRDQTAYLAYMSVVLTVAYSTLDAFGMLQTSEGYTALGTAAGMVLLGTMAIVIIEMGIRPGTKGLNSFGPEPE